MVNLYQRSDGIECRACGAAFARPDKHGPFCAPCMDKFRYEFYGHHDDEREGKTEHTEFHLNKWLTRQLELQLIRKKRYGFLAKCEALTKQDQNQNAGYQCPRFATVVVGDRYLCKVHGKTTDFSKPENARTKDFPSRVRGKHGKTMFIEEYKDPYDWLQEMIHDLCAVDPDFKMSVLKGAGVFK